MARILLAVLVSLGASIALAAGDESPPKDALKYHKALLRRPAPGYLFDRFFDAWVNEASVESLGQFLDTRAEESAADGLLAAFFYAKQGDDVRALEQFRETLAAAPGDAGAWYQKAVIEARSLNFETALTDLDKAVAAEPDEELATRVAKLRGRLLVRSGEREKAIVKFRELIAATPDDEELAEDVVELLVDEGLFDEAAKLCEQLADRTDDAYKKVLRRLRLGDIKQQAGDREAAVALYSDVLEGVGAETWLEREVLAQIERAFRREEDTGGLKSHYEKLTERYPRRVAVLRGRARVLADSGDAKGAIEQFRRVLEVTPGDRDNQQEFVQLHLRLSDYEGARKQLAALAELYPKDAELRVEIAEVAAELEDNAAAADAVDKYLELSDKSEYAHLRAARLLDRLELTDQAKAKYALLTETFPDSRSAKEARAAYLYKSEEKEAALELWSAAALGGDAQQVVRVAKTLASRQEHAAAYDLLLGQKEQLGSDPLYLAQTADAAVAVGKPADAVPLARRCVELADNPAELQAAIAQASRAIDRAEQVVEVLVELGQAERLTPQQTCLKAELHDRNGDPQQADDTLQPLVEAGDLFAVSQQVHLARSRRDWDAAADAAERLLDLPGGRDSRNLRQLVELLERAYQIEEALARLPEWKRASPGSSSPWLTEARLLSAEGKSTQAIETLRQAARQLDDPRDVLARLAQLYTEAGQLADAERIYWREYEEAEDVVAKVRAVEQIARVADQQGQSAALVANFQERRRENRTSIEPLMALAAIHRVTGDYAKRVQVLGEAAKLRPDDTQLLAQIAREQEREGDWEAARDTLRRAIEADPTQKSKQNLARLLIRWGETDEGYALLREMVSDVTDDPRELESVADAMAGAGDWGPAIDFLRPLTERFENDFRLRYLLAVALEEDDRLGESADEFLAVLACDENGAAGAAANPQAATMNWYQNELQRVAPPGLTDLINGAQRSYQAYTHRQNRGVSFSYGGSGASTTVSLPGDLDAAHGYALAHLSQIAALLDDEESAALREAAAATGVAEADAALALGGMNSPMGQRQVDYESLGDLVDRPVVMAFLVYSSQQITTLPPEFLPKAVDQFEQSFPEVALVAALSGVRASSEAPGDDHPMVAAAIRLLEKIDEPSTVTVMQVCQWRNQSPNGAAPATPDALADKLGDWLVEGFEHASTPQGYGPYLFLQIASMLRENGDPKAYIRFIEQEVERQKGTPNAQGSNPYYGQQNTLISPPAFPPPRLRDVPSSVLSLVQTANQNQQSGFYIGGMQSEPTWDDEAYRDAVAGVEDDTLRLLLASSIEGNEQLVSDAIDRLLEDEKPSLDTQLLAAGWAVRREKPIEAVDLLAKARFLPMNNDERRSLDGALVALVQQLKDDGESLEEKTLQSGRDAALRLRHGSLDPNTRSQLATAMVELGLKKEADKLEKAGQSSGAVQQYAQSMRSQPQASKDQIQRMIEAGRSDAAAKRLAQDLRGALQQVAQNPWNKSYYIRQTRQKFEGYGLLDEALAELDPGDSAAHRKHAEYAEALWLFEKHEQAIAAYGRAIELRPNEEEYRVKRMLVQADADRIDEATAAVKDLGREGAGLLASEVAAGFQDYEQSIEERLNRVELAVAAFEHALTLEKADLSWAPRFRQAVANPHYTRNGNDRLGSLYAKQNDDKSDSATRRRELHNRFCRAMLESDETACDAVAALWADAEAHDGPADDDLDELLALAADAAERHRTTRVMNTVFNRVPINYSTQSGDARLTSPAELLVKRAAATGDWSVVERLQQAHESGGDPAMRRAVRELRGLYDAPEDQFADVAKDLVRSWRGRNSAPPGGEVSPEMAVLDCYLQRGLAIEIEPVFEAFLTQASTQSGNLPDALIDYAEHLAKAEGADSAATWIEKIATKTICPRDRREAFVAKNFSNNGWSWNSPNGRIHMFEQLLNKAAQRQSLAVAVAKFLVDGELGAAGGDAARMLPSNLRIGNTSDPDSVIAFLEETGVLADAATLPLGSLTSSSLGGGDSLFSLAVQVANQSPDETKKKVTTRLADRDPQTLGLMLVRNKLAAADEPRPVFDDVAARLDELKSLEPKQRVRVAKQLATLLPDWKQRLEKEDSAPANDHAAAIAWIEAQREAVRDRLVDRLEKMSRFEELGVQGHQLDEWMAETLPPLVDDDPETAAWAYLEVCRLYDDAMAQGNVSMYYSTSTSAELLSRLSWRWRQSEGENATGLTKLALAVLNAKEKEGIVLSQNDLRQINDSLGRKWNSVGPNGRREGGPAAAFQNYYVWLAAEFADGGLADSPVQIVDFGTHFDQLNKKQVTEIVDWLDEQGAADGNEGALAANCSAAAHWALDRLNSGKNRSKYNRLPGRESMAPHYEHLNAQLSDADMPIGVRATVVAGLASLGGDRFPIETARAMVECGAEALDAECRFDQSVEYALCKSALGLAEDDPADPAVDRFVQAWRKRYITTRPRATSRNYPRSPNEAQSRDAVICVMAMQCERGEADEALRLVQRYGNLLGGRHEVIALLTRHDQIDEAARLARSGWTDFPLDTSSAAPVVYDALLEERAQKLYRALDGPIGYLAEAALVRLPDPPGEAAEANRPTASRKERALAVAKRFEQAGLPAQAMKNAALVLFHESDEATDMLGEPIAEAAKAIKLAPLSQSGGDQLRKAAALKQQHAEWSLRQGDPGPAIALLDEMTSESRNNNWNLWNLYHRAGGDLWEAMLNQIDDSSDDQVRAIADSTRRLIERSENGYPNNVNFLVALAAQSHAMLGAADEYEAWHKTLENDRNVNQILRDRGIDSASAKQFLGKLKPGDADSLATRIERLAQVLRIGKTSGWLRHSNGKWPEVRSKQGQRTFHPWDTFFSKDEMPDAVAAVAEKAGPSNHIALNLAARKLDSIGRREAGADLWRRAIDASGDNQTLRRGLRQRFVESLMRAAEFDTARNEIAAWREADSEKTEKESAAALDGLLKRISEAEEKHRAEAAKEQQSADSPNDAAADPATESAGQAPSNTAPLKATPTESTPSKSAPADSAPPQSTPAASEAA